MPRPIPCTCCGVPVEVDAVTPWGLPLMVDGRTPAGLVLLGPVMCWTCRTVPYSLGR